MEEKYFTGEKLGYQSNPRSAVVIVTVIEETRSGRVLVQWPGGTQGAVTKKKLTRIDNQFSKTDKVEG